MANGTGTIVEHRLDAEGADHLMLAGVNDHNFQELTRIFGIRVVLRRDEMVLSGDVEAIERAVPVAQHLIELSRLRAPFDVNDIARFADSFEAVWRERSQLVERVEERVFPYGDLVRSGAVVTFGADLPGVDVDEIPPLIQIEAAMTRKRPGFPQDEAFVPRQRIGLVDALRAYTVNAAYQVRMEHELGSIEVGKRADLVVLGADLFGVAPEDVHSVPVVLTMMDGRVTFDGR